MTVGRNARPLGVSLLQDYYSGGKLSLSEVFGVLYYNSGVFALIAVVWGCLEKVRKTLLNLEIMLFKVHVKQQ